MKLKIVTPTKAFIESATSDEMETLGKLLKYTNTSNQFLMKKHYNNKWWRQKNQVTWQARLDELKASINVSLIFEESGQKFIRPGSIPYIEDKIVVEVENLVRYPEPKKVVWAKPLPFQLHEYQQQSVEKLIKERHGNISLCTGAGKTACLLSICRETGFRTAIVAPSKGIFLELLEKFEKHLGKGQVGTFGAGKKRIGKKFTICIGDSLCNIKEGSLEWEFFSNLDMVAVDESHFWASETLETVCNGVMANVPYRAFVSATQTRGDGGVKLLQSIIGKTVHTLTTKEAVDNNYICPVDCRIVKIESSNPNFTSQDAIEQKRAHFLRNYNIARFIAKLANSCALEQNKQTLILVEEIGQIAMLVPLLKAPFVIAHSDKDKEKLKALGLTSVDVMENVEKFNKGEAMILCGTSTVRTGINFFHHVTAYWVGGASEISTRQGAIGRSVRKNDQNPHKDRQLPRKDRCVIFDFDVQDNYVMSAHLEKRMECYRDSCTEIKYIQLK